MIENEEGDTAKRNSVDGEENAGSLNQVESPPVNGSHHQNATKSSEDSRQDRKGDPRRFLSRLTINEWLTFFVGLGSLAVSYLTYKNATDTSDLKNAVGNLTNLAAEAHRQADELATQNRIARSNLLASNRAWLSLEVDPASDLTSYAGGESADFTVRVQNFGRSPALNVVIHVALFPSPLFSTFGGPLRNECHRDDRAYLLNETQLGRIVVPGSPAVLTVGATAEREDIDAAKRTIGPKSKRKADAFLPGMLVLVCETYRTPGDDVPHQTAIWRELSRRNPSDKAGRLALIGGQTVSKTDLVLDSVGYGDYAD